MKIEFTYTQSLQSVHPALLVHVTFEVEAWVLGDEVKILNLWWHTKNRHSALTWEALPMPDESTHEGSMLAGLLREKAREAAEKWKQENF